jgi:hypothetical protein
MIQQTHHNGLVEMVELPLYGAIVWPPSCNLPDGDERIAAIRISAHNNFRDMIII